MNTPKLGVFESFTVKQLCEVASYNVEPACQIDNS